MDRITRARLAFLTLLAGLILLVAWGLDAARPRATWVQLDGPSRLPLPGPASFRIEVPDIPHSGFLHLDLRWRGRDGRGHGALASRRIPLPDPSGSIFEVLLDVPRPPDLDVVCAVVYLSPNGRWQEYQRAATTGWIPVSPRPAGAAAPAVPPRERLVLYLPESPGTRPATPARWPRFITALVLSIAALLHVRSCALLPLGHDCAPQGRVVPGVWSAAAYLTAALVEGLDLASWVVDGVRQWAVGKSWYLHRGVPQYAVTLVVVSLGLALALWSSTRPVSAAVRLCRIGGFLWAGFAIAAALSLHLVDRLDGALIPGFSLLQIARLGSASVALAGTWIIFRRSRTAGAPTGKPPDPSGPSRWSSP